MTTRTAQCRRIGPLVEALGAILLGDVSPRGHFLHGPASLGVGAGPPSTFLDSI